MIRQGNRDRMIWAILVLVAACWAGPTAAADNPGLVLEPLPYAQNALEPYISSQTMGLHHDKHHAAYIAKANELLASSPLCGKALEEIVLATAGKADQAALFNNVAQAWNHAFFWKCLKPNGGGQPTGKLAQMIDADFGNYEGFQKAMVDTGKAQFGSGWVWLVLDGGKLKVVKTPNAENPLPQNQKPLLGIDVWEHAYYLDYQNRRPDYLTAVLEHLVNWEFVATNLPTN